MTHTLTKLAALTAKDKQGLLPCYCGHPAFLQHVEDYSCYSVICSREKHHDTQWYDTPEEAIYEWNTRPREAALIALVQEAAEDIQSLHREIVRYRTALNKIAHPNDYQHSADSFEKAVSIALAAVLIKDRLRLKPTETAS